MLTRINRFPQCLVSSSSTVDNIKRSDSYPHHDLVPPIGIFSQPKAHNPTKIPSKRKVTTEEEERKRKTGISSRRYVQPSQGQQMHFPDGDQYDKEIAPKLTKAGEFRDKDNGKGGTGDACKKNRKKDKSAAPEKYVENIDSGSGQGWKLDGDLGL